MKSADLRRTFLEFFGKHGHEHVRSSPLVPAGDPSLLFTNAGMVQFKDLFTGRESRPYSRATTSQKCVRAGGKHNDLENVGRTARHHTFFEMLGNFSFGDYFKEAAISYAWDLLTRELKVDASRLVVTVFGGDGALKLGPDDEARTLWKKIAGLSDDRIIGMGLKDNFWMMGDTGPQGPCSEIHYFVGGKTDLSKFDQEPGVDGVGWMEIWNLVFMQFERAAKDAPLTPLPRPSIDTGAGLERLAAVMQGVRSNYDTDSFTPLLALAAEMSHRRYGASMNEDDVSLRVLADHARAATFLIGDGVSPSNEGRGYVLRRIMRRAIRHGERLGVPTQGFANLCNEVIRVMADAYPDLAVAQPTIFKTVAFEEDAFRRTLRNGMALLEADIAARTTAQQQPRIITGDVVFKLYDTYGFPADLTRVIAEERGYSVDEPGFEREMNKQRARGDFAGSGEKALGDDVKAFASNFSGTDFVGYETTEAESEIAGHDPDNTLIIVGRSPFYAESGGQVGDKGKIEGPDFTFEVTDTTKTATGVILHHGKLIKGARLSGAGVKVKLIVDRERRDATRANHSATHLLHLALKQVLGGHVAQKGSLVGPDRLRFDFAHFQPMTDDEKRSVEDRVNDEVRRNLDTRTDLMSFDQAKAAGAVALFGEKYGDRVRVLHIGSESVELCGGTHVRRAGDIGLFKITQELGIAQGVRRIEAQTGAGALAYVRKLETELDAAAARMKSAPFEVAHKLDKLLDDQKALRRELDETKRKMAMGGGAGGDLMSKVREIDGRKILAARVEIGDPKALREVADQVRDKLGSGMVVLGGVQDGKVALVAAVTADLTSKLHAGKIIGELAKIVGGRGGGKPELAQAGGPDAGKLDEALDKAYELARG
jgi:alanyl-tRNA synthetase